VINGRKNKNGQFAVWHASRNANCDSMEKRAMLMFNSLIDGEWISDGERSADVNPSNTDEIVGNATRGTRAQADAAVAAAAAAFSAWSRTTHS
jgi:delta 1-pyrroline-5-carboxylate dehydrogenase